MYLPVRIDDAVDIDVKIVNNFLLNIALVLLEVPDCHRYVSHFISREV